MLDEFDVTQLGQRYLIPLDAIGFNPLVGKSTIASFSLKSRLATPLAVFVSLVDTPAVKSKIITGDSCF
ncbi:MAG: hypothetical protein ACLFSH_13880, partial [Phormidium sp.]